jgi:hypothetical protein
VSNNAGLVVLVAIAFIVMLVWVAAVFIMLGYPLAIDAIQCVPNGEYPVGSENCVQVFKQTISFWDSFALGVGLVLMGIVATRSSK